jgi:hypothetical protein
MMMTIVIIKNRDYNLGADDDNNDDDDNNNNNNNNKVWQ